MSCDKSKLPDMSNYGEYEGERWSIFVRYDDGSTKQDFYLVNHITGNWMHFENFDWTSNDFPINYNDYITWENTHPEERKKLGWKYSWMSYPDKVGQTAAMADPSWWL